MTFDEFIENLEKQGRSLEEELRTQLDEVAYHLKLRTRLQATIDPKIRTGRLFNSIEGKVAGKGDRHSKEFDIILQSGNADVFYAKYVEFGTSRMYPRLYMHKTVESQKKKLPKHLRKLMKKVLESR